jgi:hypothetical protein
MITHISQACHLRLIFRYKNEQGMATIPIKAIFSSPMLGKADLKIALLGN